MADTFIKLYRKTLDDSLWQNITLWRFFEYCLLKASYKQKIVLVGMEQIKLEPGEFVFGRKVASRECCLSEQTIRTCLKKLKKVKKLTIKSTNKFSIINVINWHRYQGNTNQSNQQINHEVTSNQPATNHIQEKKEGKEKRGGTKNTPRTQNFKPPTLKEVQDYCQTRKNNINPEVFIDWNTAKGWMIGKNKMKDWRAAIRTWEQRAKAEAPIESDIGETICRDCKKPPKDGMLTDHRCNTCIEQDGV